MLTHRNLCSQRGKKRNWDNKKQDTSLWVCKLKEEGRSEVANEFQNRPRRFDLNSFHSPRIDRPIWRYSSPDDALTWSVPNPTFRLGFSLSISLPIITSSAATVPISTSLKKIKTKIWPFQFERRLNISLSDNVEPRWLILSQDVQNTPKIPTQASNASWWVKDTWSASFTFDSQALFTHSGKKK